MIREYLLFWGGGGGPSFAVLLTPIPPSHAHIHIKFGFIVKTIHLPPPPPLPLPNPIFFSDLDRLFVKIHFLAIFFRFEVFAKKKNHLPPPPPHPSTSTAPLSFFVKIQFPPTSPALPHPPFLFFFFTFRFL